VLIGPLVDERCWPSNLEPFGDGASGGFGCHHYCCTCKVPIERGRGRERGGEKKRGKKEKKKKKTKGGAFCDQVRGFPFLLFQHL
jgi:hypothetical protein